LFNREREIPISDRPIPTTPGDRLFVGLTVSAYLHLAWIGLVGSSLWIASVGSLIWLAVVMVLG
jgi:predicted small integral membrane protein